MKKAEGDVCFGSGPTGRLGPLAQPDEPSTYRFEPYRSVHHLRLVEALRRGPVMVEVVQGGKRLEMRALRISRTEIVLERAD